MYTLPYEITSDKDGWLHRWPWLSGDRSQVERGPP